MRQKTLARSHRVSKRSEFDMVAVNTGIISDAIAPFGDVFLNSYVRDLGKGSIREQPRMNGCGIDIKQ
ncbi:hypothetical protein BKA67DRAFT_6469 [Truncatella angustata]|uniref:Uncharacterized protein n=1 Tax=Truncatella angustata TaxID=152316 RepID=A0A9P8UW37_9PEZI|nr:uncharacterized protein BKA67DRAFT_6469 [Truncatella angustata]KAH6659121.1 hypothetical protein BKA67DRAFT_6469 [Truncatella angustata]